ncbi:hypothetical protein AB0A70_10780 [Streptomyces morookaense]|uniref:hypothetical protein n=1 Tax=Streptomyces morookaense TaxID=1970 RepID=UPI0033DA7EA4
MSRSGVEPGRGGQNPRDPDRGASQAYTEQLRLLELWEDVPKEVREAQRPFDHADVYPACGCDDEALRRLDLLAEIVVAAHMSGERERSLAVARKALRMLDETKDPLRAAWFWTQQGKAAEGLARGDGRAELGRAQELVRGLPPSPVHAEVIAQAAAWSAVHTPGPESYATAEQAVELSRLVGAGSTGLSARLTLGGHRIDSGDVEGGLAEMRAVCARAVELGEVHVLGRCYINLASALEGVGRSAEAVTVADEGVEVLHRFGLRDSTAWVHGNKACSLYSLGRWPEAEEAACEALRLAQTRMPRGAAAKRFALLALARGEWDAAERELAAARGHYGTHDPQPQYEIPFGHYTLELAAARGRLTDARAAVLDSIRAAAKRLPRFIPVWQAHALYLDAELLRAEGCENAHRWAEAVAAFELLDRPYELARARYRWAASLLGAGGEGAAEPPKRRSPRVSSKAPEPYHSVPSAELGRGVALFERTSCPVRGAGNCATSHRRPAADTATPGSGAKPRGRQLRVRRGWSRSSPRPLRGRSLRAGWAPLPRACAPARRSPGTR